MRGKRAKAIRREARQYPCDDSELTWVEKQLKQGRRYIEYYDADLYQPRYYDRVLNIVHNEPIPLELKAMRLV